MISDELETARREAERLRRELREVQLRFVQAAKLESLERLASAVAHEIRNPLATLQMGLDYFMRRDGATLDDAKILQTMGAAIERANRIVLELVDFSHTRDLEFRLDNVNLAVRRALNVVEPDLNAADVRVDLGLADGLPLLRLDAMKLEQAVVNLLVNAIEASPRCGKIDVRTALAPRGSLPAAADMPVSTGGDLCLIQIRDWGKGIPHPFLSKIFEPFFTTKPKNASTGLGLFAARAIVGFHEGLLTVENTEEEGVVARIMLPLG